MDDSLPDPDAPRPSRVPDAVRIQILATEHWNLLATRSMTWNEIFTRASIFITLLSASIVAMALVAQATGFDRPFRLFALLVLSVTLLLGIGTVVRIGDAMSEDVWLLMGMNRLRYGYLEIAPELEPYFITSHHDDVAGIMKSRGPQLTAGVSPSRMLSATPAIVGIIDAVLVGIIFALLVSFITDSHFAMGITGTIASVIAIALAVLLVPKRQIHRFSTSVTPRFPQDHQASDEPG